MSDMFARRDDGVGRIAYTESTRLDEIKSHVVHSVVNNGSRPLLLRRNKHYIT